MMLDVLTFHTLPNLHCLDLSGTPSRRFPRRNQNGHGGNDRFSRFAAQSNHPSASGIGPTRLWTGGQGAGSSELHSSRRLCSEPPATRPFEQLNEVQGHRGHSPHVQRRLSPQPGVPGPERQPHWQRGNPRARKRSGSAMSGASEGAASVQKPDYGRGGELHILVRAKQILAQYPTAFSRW